MRKYHIFSDVYFERNAAVWRDNIERDIVMTKAEVEEKVIKIISEQLGREADTISGSSDISNDLGADSLDQAELMIAFEEEFDIDIDEESSQNITTVNDVVEQIYKHMS